MRHRRSHLNIGSLLATTLIVLACTACQQTPEKMVFEEQSPRHFFLTYQAVARNVPADAKSAYMWVPYPPSTPDQLIGEAQIDSKIPYEIVTEPRYGNQAVRFELKPAMVEQLITITFDITRLERRRQPSASDLAAEEQPAGDPAAWLEADFLVPVSGDVVAWAQAVTAGKTTPVEQVQAIYEDLIANFTFETPADESGAGQGDLNWAHEQRRGDCTDFNALLVGYCRALGIPARLEMGVALPETNGRVKDIFVKHCWSQVHLGESGWVPVDATAANQQPASKDYYFGRLDVDRVLFSLGRDLAFPGMKTEALNYFYSPYAEVNGELYPDIDHRVAVRDL
jgi:transglutaminase-like putative cysteine protease